MHSVILLALNKPAYAAAAFNLALSIKHHNPSIHITLLSDDTHRGCYRDEHLEVFDDIARMAADDYTNHGQFCPAKAKISIYKYSRSQHALYVDADSICLKPLDSLFADLKGQAFKSQRVKNYTQWTDAATFRSFFDVEPGQTINAGWIYFENDAVFRQAEQYYAKGFPADKLEYRWGLGPSDELFFNAALERLRVDAGSDVRVMYFDFSDDPRSLSQLIESHYFMTFFGTAKTTRVALRDWYDRYVSELCAHKGIMHRFPIGDIVAHRYHEICAPRV